MDTLDTTPAVPGETLPKTFAFDVDKQGFSLFDMNNVLVEWYPDRVVARWMDIGGRRYGVGRTTAQAFAALGEALLQEFHDASAHTLPDAPPKHPEVAAAQKYLGAGNAWRAAQARRAWWRHTLATAAVSAAVTAALLLGL